MATNDTITPKSLDDYRGLSETDLNDELKAIDGAIFQLKFKRALRQLETPGDIRKLKHAYAQIKTVLAEKARAV